MQMKYDVCKNSIAYACKSSIASAAIAHGDASSLQVVIHSYPMHVIEGEWKHVILSFSALAINARKGWGGGAKCTCYRRTPGVCPR